MVTQVDMPRAYVCADSKIYEASQWYICQVLKTNPLLFGISVRDYFVVFVGNIEMLFV